MEQHKTEPANTEDKGSVIAEITPLAVGIGIVLAVVMAAANTYLGLYVGMTVSASIPAAVISMAILRGVFQRGTILENNIAQTIASTGESLAAGVIFTVPALLLVGAWQNFEFWPTTLIAMFGGLLGVVFMVPMRRAFIVNRKDLVYPEGLACAEVLHAGQRGGAGALWIGAGLLAGAVMKFFSTGIKLVMGTVEWAAAKGTSVFYFGADMSAALLGVGYIVNLNIASHVFAGGLIGWVIAIPMLGGFDGSLEASEAAWTLWSGQVRYIGVGAMLVGGLWSIWSVRLAIFGALAAITGVSRPTGPVARTERDMAPIALGIIFLLAVLGTFLLYDFFLGEGFKVALVATLVMVPAAFLFVAVATYIAGLVGSSNSPVSGMTICALLLTAAVLLVLGIKGDSAILACLGVAGVVCCAACTSGDISQDLKTGLLVGATPARQQGVELIGVLIPAFVFAPVLTLLHNSYVIGEGLIAPQAALFASLVQGLFGDGTVPWNMIGIGAALAVVVIAADVALRWNAAPFRVHIMPLAVGIYLPFSLGVPIFLGGLIRYFLGRREQGRAEAAHDRGILIGSGLIAGEALMGIGLAIPISLGFVLFDAGGGTSISLALFGILVLGFAALSFRRPAH